MPDSVYPAEVEGPLSRVVKPHCSYTVIFSSTLAPFDLPAVDASLTYEEAQLAARVPAFTGFVDRLLAEMSIDQKTGVAERILVLGLENAVVTGSTSVSKPSIRSRAYEVSSGRILISLDAPAAGFVRLSHACHPSLRILRNGAPIRAFKDATWSIVVPVIPGPNTFEIAPNPNPLTAVGWFISSLVLALLVAGTAVPALLDGRGPPAGTWDASRASMPPPRNLV
jgi:hypothetical protein